MAIIENKGGFINPDDILQSIVSFNGLFRKIFGELHDDIVYDKEAEFCRRMLSNVYQFKDTTDIFPKILAEKRFHTTLETVFRFFRTDNNTPQWAVVR